MHVPKKTKGGRQAVQFPLLPEHAEHGEAQ